jgi:hypothetical protein
MVIPETYPGQGYSRNVSWSRLFQKRILVKVIPETYLVKVIPERFWNNLDRVRS